MSAKLDALLYMGRVEGRDYMTTLAPALRAEAESAAAIMNLGCRGASASEITRMMSRMASAFPNVTLSAAEAEQRLSIYEIALADIPPDILGRACIEAVKTLRFFPTVAELRTCAGHELGRRHWMMRQLNRLASMPPELPAAPQLTPAQLDEVEALRIRVVSNLKASRL